MHAFRLTKVFICTTLSHCARHKQQNLHRDNAPSNSLYKGQQKQTERSVLSDDSGGDRGGKVFPEKMVFLVGLEE